MWEFHGHPGVPRRCAKMLGWIAPPFFLIHGTADKTVNVKHSDLFHAALKQAEVGDVEYLRVDDAGHGVFNQHRQTTGPAMAAFFKRTLLAE